MADGQRRQSMVFPERFWRNYEGFSGRCVRPLRTLAGFSTIARMFATLRLRALTASFVVLITFVIGCGSSDSSDQRLRILVSNDDGVAAEGIDALVRALLVNPDNVLVVSAPAENSSGSGDDRIGEGNAPCTEGTGMAMPAATASGYETDVWAVDGCPEDAVLYGLENLYEEGDAPHVVVTGLNEGQNVGFTGNLGTLSQISGTVGAAKTAACSGVPAVASSQGDPALGGEFDYESGVVAVLDWLEENRTALLAGEVGLDEITSINIPTCEAGTEIRGTAQVPLGTEVPDGVGSLLSDQDCGSTLEDPQDDLEAFFFGFIAETPVPSNSSGTCDKLE